MEIPEDVVRLIHEYARPLTRPDWRSKRPGHYHAMIEYWIITENIDEYWF